MTDLSDAEFAELDRLLADTPEPLEPIAAVMLDGYLCGVLVQPVLVAQSRWLPPIFDVEGRSLPQAVDPAWLARCTKLIERRHAALQRELAEDGWFDPLLPDDDDEDVAELPEDLRALPAVSRTLMPWVAGFQHAAIAFPGLLESDDEAVSDAIDRLRRHLPPEDDADRARNARLDSELPLATLEAGIQELVQAVVEIDEATRDARFRVETVRRAAPKVGRNEPCPCGSGVKFKQCHGA